MKDPKVSIYKSQLEKMTADEAFVYLYSLIFYFENKSGVDFELLRKATKFGKNKLIKILHSLKDKGFIKVVNFGNYKLYKPFFAGEKKQRDEKVKVVKVKKKRESENNNLDNNCVRVYDRGSFSGFHGFLEREKNISVDTKDYAIDFLKEPNGRVYEWVFRALKPWVNMKELWDEYNRKYPGG